MADNLNVTAGTGTVVATDQVGSAHYQKVKLADGTPDSSTMIAASTGVSANALRVVLANDYPASWSATAAYANAQTAVELKASPGASASLYITDAVFSNGATAGTIKLLDSGPADRVSVIYLAVNGNIAMHFATPIKLTADKALQVTSVTVSTHSVTVNGYTAA
jgi:hypothetical protein